MTKKINLGGWERCEGGPGSPVLNEVWEHMDMRKAPGVTHVGDVCDLPREWDGEYDEVRASHVIEHIAPKDVLAALEGWVRLLKHGGILRVYCPNFRLMAEDVVDGRITIGEFSRYAFGDQDYFLNLHRAAYDQASLVALMKEVGLTILSIDPRPSAYRYDMGVQAIKS